MRSSRWIVLLAVVAGCSGGRDPVRTVGGDGEYAGPGAGDPFSGLDDNPSTTPTSTLLVLCIQACAHLHAADCDSLPAHMTDHCELQCQQEVVTKTGPCTDEDAALYACTAEAEITCSSGVGGAPLVVGCESEVDALSECVAPGSACVSSPESDDACQALGLPHFFFCSGGASPPPGCFSLSDQAVCCP